MVALRLLLISMLWPTWCVADPTASTVKMNYQALLEQTDDKDGLEAIIALHSQLDNNHDGSIEPFETGDFISQHGGLDGGRDQRKFHSQDQEITVQELWNSWLYNQVRNWTEDDMVEWLQLKVGLPQYADRFKSHHLTGLHLPRLATDVTFMFKMIGITNPIHRSKLTLKAMDAVLFGPPKEPSSLLKDLVLSGLLASSCACMLFAYYKHKINQEQLQQLMTNMEGLAKAEQALERLQSQDPPPVIEVCKLKEEVQVLKQELELTQWSAPVALQHWLQLTFELECQSYGQKKRAAVKQFELAKDMCDKLKRKRSSLMGSFATTHGKSIDEVDRSILEAKAALVDITNNLTEHAQRWQHIQTICGFDITHNAGLVALKNWAAARASSRDSLLRQKDSSSSLRSVLGDKVDAPAGTQDQRPAAVFEDADQQEQTCIFQLSTEQAPEQWLPSTPPRASINLTPSQSSSSLPLLATGPPKKQSLPLLSAVRLDKDVDGQSNCSDDGLRHKPRSYLRLFRSKRDKKA